MTESPDLVRLAAKLTESAVVLERRMRAPEWAWLRPIVLRRRRAALYLRDALDRKRPAHLPGAGLHDGSTPPADLEASDLMSLERDLIQRYDRAIGAAPKHLVHALRAQRGEVEQSHLEFVARASGACD